MSNKSLRYNSQITAPEVRVVSEGGNILGIFPIAEAATMARSQGLDLIEISPNASPPVCKITDFGKYKYDLKKKQTESRKKSKTTSVKEVKFTVNIAEHDYAFKIKHIEEFIEEGHSVKVSCRIKGRDKIHSERISILFNRIIEECSGLTSVHGQVQYSGFYGEFTLVKATAANKLKAPSQPPSPAAKAPSQPLGPPSPSSAAAPAAKAPSPSSSSPSPSPSSSPPSPSPAAAPEAKAPSQPPSSSPPQST